MNQQPPNQASAVRLLRPEHIQAMQYLNAPDKQRYKEGLQALWLKIEGNPPDSQEHIQAKQRVMDFTRMVSNKVKTLQMRNQQANAQGQANLTGGQQPQQQQQQQPPQQPNQGIQSQPQTQMPTQTQVPIPTPSIAAQKPAMNMPAHQSQPPTMHNNSVNAGANPTVARSTGGPAMSSAQAPVQVSRHIIDHINKLPWHLLPTPSASNQEQSQKLVSETKGNYMRALHKMELLRTRVAKVDAHFKDRQEKGIPLSQDELKRLQEQRTADRKAHSDAETFVKNVRAQLTTAQAPGQSNGAQVQSTLQSGRPQPIQTVNTSGVGSHSMQVPTTTINAAIDAAKTTQIAAAGNRPGSIGGAQQPQQQPQQPAQQQQQQQPPQQQSQQAQQQPQQPQPLVTNPPQAQAAPGTPSTSAPRQTPHSAPVPPPAQVKVEPGNNMQHPPPVNTALAASSSAHMPSAGTPTQPSTRVQTPQSASAANSSVRPLSHAAAVNRANSSTNINGQPNSSGPLSNNTPGSAGMTSQPQHTHSHPQSASSSTSTLTSKMPIPKNLPDKAIAPPVPVAVGGGNTPGRPTYGGGNGAGGVMNQPVIPKMPVPQFDTEGDHVLSKKKLDELVRQVCGGGSPGADGNYLTPDVEEVSLVIVFVYLA